jgi:cytochrome c5
MRFRPLSPLILWILLALLPLRGWATSDMQVSMALGTMTSAVVAASSTPTATKAQPHAAAPCHGDGVTADAGGTPEPSTGSHAACTLCDLCHSVAMTTAESVLDTRPRVAAERVSLVSTDTGHLLIDRLDRPPRSPLPA